jgi:hypothetical protein
MKQDERRHNATKRAWTAGGTGIWWAVHPLLCLPPSWNPCLLFSPLQHILSIP